MGKLLNNVLQPFVLEGITYGTDEFTSDFNSNPMVMQVEPDRSMNFSLPDINNIIRGEIARYWLHFDYLPIARYRQIIKDLRKPEVMLSYYDFETDEIKSGNYYTHPFDKFIEHVKYPKGVATLVGIWDIDFVLIATNNKVNNFRIAYVDRNIEVRVDTAFFGDTIQIYDGESLTNQNYRLDGWVDDVGNNYFSNEYIVITKDLTLTAVWKTSQIRVLSFDYLGAYFIDASTQDEDNFRVNQQSIYSPPIYTAIGDLPKPTLKIKTSATAEVFDTVGTLIGFWNIGYNWQMHGTGHAEWLEEQMQLSQDGAVRQYTESTPYTVNGNITIYAHWMPKEFTLAFDTNGGSAITSITKGFQSPIERPSNPTKNGHDFAGWYKDDTLNIVFTDWRIPYSSIGTTIIYAKWQQQVQI